MKILHVIGGGDTGGAKTHVLTLISHLQKFDTVKLVPLRSGHFAREAEGLGIDTKVIASGNIIKDFFHTVKEIKQGQYDVVHSHGAKANVFCAVSKLFHKIPVVTTVHSDYQLDYMGNPLKQITYGLLNTISLRLLDFRSGVSDTMGKILISRGFQPNRIFTIYNGIDFDVEVNRSTRKKFFEKYNFNIDDNDFLIGIAVRLTAVKDVKTLITAFAKACENNDRLRLAVAGDGEDMSMLTKLANTLGVGDKVVFLGWISNVDEFYSVLDLNCMCSISETFPYSLLEGIRHKVCTVSSNVGGIPSLIDNGINGFTFNVGDVDRLAEIITTLYNDPELTQSFGNSLYEKSKISFSIDKMCETQRDIYQKIIRWNKGFNKRANRVLICGAYGLWNTGDDAILQAILNDLHSINDRLNVTVISRNPNETKVRQRVNSIYSFNPFSMLYNMIRSRLYINGGGNLITDVTSTRSLIYYLFTIVCAKVCGAKVLLYGCGIGPLRRKNNRNFSGFVLNNFVDSIALREENAKRELVKLNVNKPNVVVGADTALRLSPAADIFIEAIMKAYQIPSRKKLLGISVRSWKNSENTVRCIARAADYMWGKYGFTSVFIPMHKSDIEISKQVAELMKSPCIVLDTLFSVPECIGLIGRMDLILGMRLHSLIFAVSQNVQVLGLAYDTKISAFIELVNINTCIKIKDLTVKNLMQNLDDLVANHEKLAPRYAAASVNLKHRTELNVQTLKSLL